MIEDKTRVYLKEGRKNKRWTIKDIKYLKERYPEASTLTIAKEMGLSFGSVKNALERYRIYGAGKKERVSIPTLSECMEHIEAIRAEIANTG